MIDGGYQLLILTNSSLDLSIHISSSLSKFHLLLSIFHPLYPYFNLSIHILSSLSTFDPIYPSLILLVPQVFSKMASKERSSRAMPARQRIESVSLEGLVSKTKQNI